MRGQRQPQRDDGAEAPGIAARRALMAVCAKATCAELAAALDAAGYAGRVDDLRHPDSGLVLVRGRIGGEGAPFNLGEATVSRAAVRIDSGESGFAYHLGRDQAKARLAATMDALFQSPGYRAAVEASVAPIAARLAAGDEAAARQTAATRVNFFTLVRGED